MPMVSRGYTVLAHYPDGSEHLLTLYAEPLEGKVIPHGWVVSLVTPRDDDENGVKIDWEISVTRPPLAAAR